MHKKFVITRSGSNRHDHSGSGDWLAQTGSHDTEHEAIDSGNGGVPNSDQVFVERSKFSLTIRKQWIDFPSSDDPQKTVRCNVCEVFEIGSAE